MTTETMQTGDVSRRMGIPLTEKMLTDAGFTPVGKDKRAVLWAQSDYPAMCKAIAKTIFDRQNVPMQPRPDRSPAAKKTATQETTKKVNTAPVDDDDEL